MKVDFHCHTQASDGALSPRALIDLAKHYNVSHLAITDHDTTRGYEQALDYATEQGIQLFSGVEASCEWEGHSIHIVGLDFDVNNPALQQGLQHIRDLRWQRANAILAKLLEKPNFNHLNLTELLQQQVGQGVVGRGHFAQILIEQHYVKNSQQAFDKYLKKGRIGYVKSQWPALQQVVEWITGAGGIAVIAHPGIYGFTSRKLNRLIESFIEAGGQGMEVVNQPRHSADITGMAERAKRYGLLSSLGSDFHRPEQHWRGLGWLAPLPAHCKPVWQAFKTPLQPNLSASFDG
ncbi:MAG: PHP domain-containing protein [Gammaproteobacteria bacterium]|nr:PHP domain-containing protein [Gammaproteobacteria bacterium]